MKTRIKRPIWFSLISLLALAGLLFWTTSCSREGAGTKPADVDYYTCTMHPSVKKYKPTDKCPICSMDLVPVMKRNVGASERGSVGSVERTNAEARPTLNAPDAPHAPHDPHDPAADAPHDFTVPVARQQQI